jgi:hypothetical protein
MAVAADKAHSAETSMQSWTSSKQSPAGPRRRGRYDRDDESLDEAPRLLEEEPGDIEQANPVDEVDENESVEEIEDAEENMTVFDEGPPGHDEPHE